MSEKGLDWKKEGQFSKICGIIYHGTILSSQQLFNSGNVCLSVPKWKEGEIGHGVLVLCSDHCWKGQRVCSKQCTGRSRVFIKWSVKGPGSLRITGETYRKQMLHTIFSLCFPFSSLFKEHVFLLAAPSSVGFHWKMKSTGVISPHF